MIRSVLDVASAPGKPWLIVGKGPSLDGVTAATLAALPSRFRVFALNHTCRIVHPDIAHFADIEALHECADVLGAMLDDGCRERGDVCLPWWPHVGFRPGRVHLADHASEGTVLGRCRALGRLLSYNSTIASNLPRRRGLPEILVRYFSAVAAVNILARAGQRELYSVGIDGGTGYAARFADQRPLANGRPNFDVQFREIARTCARHRIVLRALDKEVRCE